jgi:hypothetical protein
VTRLHGTAARAVDAQNHALRVLIFERGLQTGDHVVRACRAFRPDHTAKLDQRGVFAGRSAVLFAEPSHPQEEQQEQIDEEQRLEEYPPDAGAALFLNGGERDFLECLALPSLVTGAIGF